MFTILTVILASVAAETPVPDNSKTQYCVAEARPVKGEQPVNAKTPCQTGSAKVDTNKPGLAERKSK
jgi:hypothetical protein